LKVKDRIISFAGKQINKPKDLPKAVRQAKIGQKVNLKVIREGKALTLSIVPQVLEENRFSSISEDSNKRRKRKISGSNIFGEFQLVEPSSSNLRLFRHPGWAKHPIVVNLRTNSKAFREGLREGDMLYQINGVMVARVSSAKKIFKKGRSYKLNLLRYDHSSDRYHILSIRLSF
ncbi:MAG: PDZ domain-containing protein, partial [Oligoflexia bacterium]|nr:PDZ domain-containing protein [Oligoflexia bacterium]